MKFNMKKYALWLLILNVKQIISMEADNEDLINFDQSEINQSEENSIPNILLKIENDLNDQFLFMDENAQKNIAKKLYIIMQNKELKNEDAIVCYDLVNKFAKMHENVIFEDQNKKIEFNTKLFCKENIKKIASLKEDIHEKFEFFNEYEGYEEIVELLNDKCLNYFKNNTTLNKIPENDLIEYLFYLFCLLKSDNAKNFHEKIVSDILRNLLTYKTDNIQYLHYIYKICSESLKYTKKNECNNIFISLYNEELYNLLCEFYNTYSKLTENKGNKYDLILEIIDYIDFLKNQKIKSEWYDIFYHEVILLEKKIDKIHEYLDCIEKWNEGDLINFFNHLTEICEISQLLEQTNNIISIYSDRLVESDIEKSIKIIIEKLESSVKSEPLSLNSLVLCLTKNEFIAKNLFKDELFQNAIIDSLLEGISEEEWKELNLENIIEKNVALKEELTLILVRKHLKNIQKIQSSLLNTIEKENQINKEYNLARALLDKNKNNDLLFEKSRVELGQAKLELSSLTKEDKIDILFSLVDSSYLNDSEQIERYAIELIYSCLENTKANKKYIEQTLERLFKLDCNKDTMMISEDKVVGRVQLYKKIMEELKKNKEDWDKSLEYNFCRYYLKAIKNEEDLDLEALKFDIDNYFKFFSSPIKENSISTIIPTLCKYLNQNKISKEDASKIIQIVMSSSCASLFKDIKDIKDLVLLEDVFKMINLYFSDREDRKDIDELKNIVVYITGITSKAQKINCRIIKEYIQLLISTWGKDIKFEFFERFDLFNFFKMAQLADKMKNEKNSENEYYFFTKMLHAIAKKMTNEKCSLSTEDSIDLLKEYLCQLYKDEYFLNLCMNELLLNKNIELDYTDCILELFQKVRVDIIKSSNANPIIEFYNNFLSIFDSIRAKNKHDKLYCLYSINDFLNEDLEKFEGLYKSDCKKNIIEKIIRHDGTFLFNNNKCNLPMYEVHLELIDLDNSHVPTFIKIFTETLNRIENDAVSLYYNQIIKLLDAAKILSDQEEDLKSLYEELLNITKIKLLSLSMEELEGIKEEKNKHFDLKEIKAEVMRKNIKDEMVFFIGDMCGNNDFSLKHLDNNEKEAKEAVESEAGYVDQWYKIIENFDVKEREDYGEDYIKRCNSRIIRLANLLYHFLGKESREEDINQIFIWKESPEFKKVSLEIGEASYINKILYIKSFFSEIGELFSPIEHYINYEKGFFSIKEISVNKKGFECEWLQKNEIFLGNLKKKFLGATLLLLGKDITLPKDHLKNLFQFRLNFCSDFFKKGHAQYKKKSTSRLEDLLSKGLENNNIDNGKNKMIESIFLGQVGFVGSLLSKASKLLEVPKKIEEKQLQIKEEEK